MTKDEIISIARSLVGDHSHNAYWPFFTADLERFAALVAAKEREACARVCEELKWSRNTDWEAGTLDCASAIRARGTP